MLTAILLGYRSARIASLPQIDEPFDVEAFCSVTIPDEENAFVEYREAFDLFVEFPGKDSDWESYNGLVNGNWDDSPPAFVAWIMSNERAFDAWLIGTAKPNAMFTPRSEITYGDIDYTSEARSLVRIAMLRAGQHLSNGDTDEAWKILHAAFRYSRHVGQNGTTLERQTGIPILLFVCTGLLSWAHHANTTTEDIDNAIALISDDFASMTPPYSVTLKHEYLRAKNCAQQLGSEFWVFDPSPIVDTALIFVMGEPEYSEALLRLVLANQLTGIDMPSHSRPKLVPGEDRAFDIPSVPGKHSSGVELSRLLTTVSAIETAAGFPWMHLVRSTLDIEKTNLSTTLAALSIESYVRKHGRFPLSQDEFLTSNSIGLFTDPNNSAGGDLIYGANDEFAIVYSLGTDGIDDGHSIVPQDAKKQLAWSRMASPELQFEGYRIPLWRPAEADGKAAEEDSVVPDNVQD